METKKIKVVEKVAKSSGSNKNGAWTMWLVTDEEGTQYSTFEGSRFEVGQTYDIKFEQKVNGQFTQNRIAKENGQKRSEVDSGGSVDSSEVIRILKRLEEKVDRIDFHLGGKETDPKPNVPVIDTV